MSEQLLLEDVCLPGQPEASIIRPIHYLGSKLRLSSAIREAIDEVDATNGRVCDLFAGSGTVASILSRSRPVTSVDIQEYSRVLCSAVLRPSPLCESDIDNIISRIHSSEITEQLLWSYDPLIVYEGICLDRALNGDPLALAEIFEKGSLATLAQGLSLPRGKEYQKATDETLKRLVSNGLEGSADSITSRYFGGIYFSFHQSVLLDALLSCAQNEARENRDSITAAVLSTASSIVNTVGKQFAQPIRPRAKNGSIKQGFVDKVKKDRNVQVIPVFRASLEKFLSLQLPDFEHQAITGNYIDVLRGIGSELSCVYADPPYTRDHYSRYYHVLETMCRRDNPAISTVKRNGEVVASRGIYRTDRHQSPFCIRSEAPSAFRMLFEQVHELGIPLVLSYSPHEEADGTHPRVVSISQITKLARQIFGQVEVMALGNLTHRNLNSKVHKLPTRNNAELIIKCH